MVELFQETGLLLFIAHAGYKCVPALFLAERVQKLLKAANTAQRAIFRTKESFQLGAENVTFGRSCDQLKTQRGFFLLLAQDHKPCLKLL